MQIACFQKQALHLRCWSRQNEKIGLYPYAYLRSWVSTRKSIRINNDAGQNSDICSSELRRSTCAFCRSLKQFLITIVILSVNIIVNAA